ncbi:hypothetical protein SDC9_148807 [bioreactor metagenome]|uniref:Uncharacterized protein n=1 Tax=bioreactor metagenome TaxID=1076179 RepID=A0A645EIL4_9ZZZZ
MLNHIVRKNKNTNTQNYICQNFTKLRQLDLKRCLSLFCLCNGVRNFAHFSFHGSGDHNGLASAVNYNTTHISHVFTVTQSDITLFIRCNDITMLA